MTLFTQRYRECAPEGAMPIKKATHAYGAGVKGDPTMKDLVLRGARMRSTPSSVPKRHSISSLSRVLTVVAIGVAALVGGGGSPGGATTTCPTGTHLVSWCPPPDPVITKCANFCVENPTETYFVPT